MVKLNDLPNGVRDVEHVVVTKRFKYHEPEVCDETDGEEAFVRYRPACLQSQPGPSATVGYLLPLEAARQHDQGPHLIPCQNCF